MISAEIQAAMRKTNDIFCSSVVTQRDTSALDKVYTPNASILPPGTDLINGLPAIKKFWSEAISGLDVKGASLTTVSADLAGDDVIEIGRASLTLANNQAVAIKYVVQWKLHEGTWKWNTDIWNMNE